MWGATTHSSPLPGNRGNFNPRSPCGERRLGLKALRSRFIFQSTLPVGGATSPYRASYLSHGLFQSTLPVGGATGRRDEDSRIQKISIHAPRGGSDFMCHSNKSSRRGFQSTLPVGGATESPKRRSYKMLFQSTLPVGGATLMARTTGTRWIIFQSTLPVGGATSASTSGRPRQPDFNPRSPWGERQVCPPSRYLGELFQSTLPVGGATVFPGCGQVVPQISIHAPRGGSDGPLPFRQLPDRHFNPRSPWGERPYRIAPAGRKRISIHAPRGGSDACVERVELSPSISIHAPRGGSDTTTR